MVVSELFTLKLRNIDIVIVFVCLIAVMIPCCCECSEMHEDVDLFKFVAHIPVSCFA